MKIGKVSETVLKRSVLKQLHKRRSEVLCGASVGEDCCAIQLQEDETFVMSTDPITGAAKDIGRLAIVITANDLASAGATPIGVMLTILLPEQAKESALKEIIKQADEMCAKLHMQIMGGHTEVTAVVNQPLISVVGVGKVKNGEFITTGGARPGMDIVVSKWIGIEGTAIISKEKEEQLKSKFTQSFLEKAQALEEYIPVVDEAQVAKKSGVCAMHDVTEGGIFGALWEMAQASDVGLDIDIKKIPVKQETIEICEFFGINPYELISSGCMLMATEDGNGLVEDLKKAGILGTIIGKATDTHERVIRNEEEKRFLEPPKTDELYKVM